MLCTQQVFVKASKKLLLKLKECIEIETRNGMREYCFFDGGSFILHFGLAAKKIQKIFLTTEMKILC